MASIADTIEPLSDREHRGQLTRAIVASTIGTTIEWYDFFLYSTVTGLVFAKLYFPGSDPLAGTLSAFGIYAVGFAARPVGAAIFGHFGDRIGRKSTLIASLLLMGIATFLVAFVPTYESIGIWGAVALTVLRFIQGVGVGGEWGGSVLLSMEWAKTNKHRGFVASWPQFGVPAGLFLANLAVMICSALTTNEEFNAWGWRIPFFVSIVLVAIGLWIRLGILETPTFRRLVATNRIEKAPVREVFRLQSWEVIQSAFLRMAEQAPFYIFTAFVFTYAVGTLKVERSFVLNAVMCSAALSFIWVPLFGALSDRIGRKRMYMIGAATVMVYGFVYFFLLDSKSPTLMFIAIVLSLIPHDMMYGPQAALIAELFTGRLRYTGASLGYQLASIIAGGPAPLIAVWLLSVYGSGYAIATFIAACGVITMIALIFVKDHTGKDIALEYDDA
jgi:metabolite-proton symporter